MGKEVKIGLAVIGSLLCVFAGVLAMRLKKEQPVSALDKVAAAEKEGKIGQQNKPAKTAKEGKTGADHAAPSSASLNQPLSSRKRHAKPPADAQTDRYGRPVENDWTLPSNASPQNEPPQDVAENEPSPLGPPDAAETDAPVDSRYNRYADRDPVQEPAADGGEVPGEQPSQEDGLPPTDRFAQMPGGLSLSDDEPADGAPEPAYGSDEPPAGREQAANETDEPSAGADEPAENPAPGNAPRLAEPTSGGLSFDDEPAEPVEGAIQEEDRGQGDAGLRLATSPDDEPSAAEPMANDRSANRFDRRRVEPTRLAHEEPLEEPAGVEEPAGAEEPIEPSRADVRERWQEPASDTYTVAANDNFWRISQKVYGTGAYFKALEEHNRRQLGDRKLLNVGDVVATPTIEELQRDYPGLSPKPRDVPGRRRTSLASSGARGGRSYTVSEGDTLFDIAREELGKASRWAEIYELNRDQLGEDFNYLSPGMRLAMPPRGAGAAPIAARPDRDSFRR